MLPMLIPSAFRITALLSYLFYAGHVAAQSLAPSPATVAPAALTAANVVISGMVPDEATKAALLARLQEVYGTGKVIDQMSIGSVVAPENWSMHIQKLISAKLKAIHKGQITVDGKLVALKGEVINEMERQTLTNDVAGALNSSYTVRNGLRIAASSQTVLDNMLANRLIEFENGSALLTASGKRIVDEIALALQNMQQKKIDIIGHTDDTGTRAQNLALSLARAESVKIYLISQGLKPQLISTAGMGPDQPLLSNLSDAGRQRNRRIEFRVSQ